MNFKLFHATGFFLGTVLHIYSWKILLYYKLVIQIELTNYEIFTMLCTEISSIFVVFVLHACDLEYPRRNKCTNSITRTHTHTHTNWNAFAFTCCTLPLDLHLQLLAWQLNSLWHQVHQMASVLNDLRASFFKLPLAHSGYVCVWVRVGESATAELTKSSKGRCKETVWESGRVGERERSSSYNCFIYYSFVWTTHRCSSKSKA